VLYVSEGRLLQLQSITIADGGAATGGAINNFGMLTVINSTLSGNKANSGGAIYNQFDATLVVSNSTLSGNQAIQMAAASTTRAR